MNTSIIYRDLGIIDYADAWHLQSEIFDANVEAKRVEQPTEHTLLFCEHPHVLTLGKSAKENNVLFNEDYLKQRGVSLFHVDRGGDVTYHGFGQLVGYPIFDLDRLGVGLKQYVHLLEEIVIRLLDKYGIRGQRLEGATGVWLDVDKSVNCRKICAIGVRSSRYITMHGFALNVNTDLSYFSLINPCGFVDKGVTSMQKELNMDVDMSVVKQQMRELFIEVFFPRNDLLKS